MDNLVAPIQKVGKDAETKTSPPTNSLTMNEVPKRSVKIHPSMKGLWTLKNFALAWASLNFVSKAIRFGNKIEYVYRHNFTFKFAGDHGQTFQGPMSSIEQEFYYGWDLDKRNEDEPMSNHFSKSDFHVWASLLLLQYCDAFFAVLLILSIKNDFYVPIMAWITYTLPFLALNVVNTVIDIYLGHFFEWTTCVQLSLGCNMALTLVMIILLALWFREEGIFMRDVQHWRSLKNADQEGVDHL